MAEGAAAGEEGRGGATAHQGIEADGIEEFLQMMVSGKMGGKLVAEHSNLKRQERHVYFFSRNPDKNRFTNMLLYNEGAVLLKPGPKEKEAPYYHASEVSTKLGRYILAQAPMENTLLEWYHLIWQQKVHIIVALVDPFKNPAECVPYFEAKKNKKKKVGGCYTARTITSRTEQKVTNYELKLKNKHDKSSGERTIQVVVLDQWKHQIVADPKALVALLLNTLSLSKSMHAEEALMPILVHGCAGIRRTGAFVTMAAVCQSINQANQVCLTSFTRYLRQLRYGAGRNKGCYASAVCGILQYAHDQGFISPDKRPKVEAAMKLVQEQCINLKEKKENEATSTLSGFSTAGEEPQPQ